ncbi:acetyl esterase/lipase [Fusibacter tunisiensis]|uniref:Acetyl esterase/lipase n=2 Tax=Fusibacter tunisiensis TaxID=1008308 RepID=A0ABS2MUI6_9FIRM|nr:acetyl esterase/lipase [Fusibacter tunisiensis]
MLLALQNHLCFGYGRLWKQVRVIIIPDYRKSFEAPYPAALSLYARDRNEVKIAFQMPLYPMIDDRMNLDSAIDNIAPVWDSKSNYIAWKLYLGDLFETNEIPIYAAPARADSYKNMPTTITFVGDLEPFRDETIHYVQRLTKIAEKSPASKPPCSRSESAGGG